jgi:hypothetical protein
VLNRLAASLTHTSRAARGKFCSPLWPGIGYNTLADVGPGLGQLCFRIAQRFFCLGQTIVGLLPAFLGWLIACPVLAGCLAGWPLLYIMCYRVFNSIHGSGVPPKPPGSGVPAQVLRCFKSYWFWCTGAGLDRRLQLCCTSISNHIVLVDVSPV